MKKAKNAQKQTSLFTKYSDLIEYITTYSTIAIYLSGKQLIQVTRHISVSNSSVSLRPSSALSQLVIIIITVVVADTIQYNV